jgi:protein-S-isoprenylcysteine O-methyltransferase Ste14
MSKASKGTALRTPSGTIDRKVKIPDEVIEGLGEAGMEGEHAQSDPGPQPATQWRAGRILSVRGPEAVAPSLTAGRVVMKSVVGVTLFVLVLLAPAGTWRWPAAWIFLGLYLAFAVPVGIWLFRTNPTLLVRRLDWTKGGPKTWDRALMAAFTPVFVLVFALAGLDFRLGWSHLPGALRVIAFVLVGAFYVLFALVLRENPFLFRVVEIQPEAGHRVVTTGPYAVVRHPMYAGYMLWMPAVAVALGSLPALVPAALIATGVVVRTVLEDRALHAELPGYPEYAAKVRWRLLPHVF